jgi:hypothetical protein
MKERIKITTAFAQKKWVGFCLEKIAQGQRERIQMEATLNN